MPGESGCRNGALFGDTYTATERAAQTTVREGSFGGKIHSARLLLILNIEKKRTNTN